MAGHEKIIVAASLTLEKEMCPFFLNVDLFVYAICLIWLFHVLVSLFLNIFSAFFPMAICILSPKSCNGRKLLLSCFYIVRRWKPSRTPS